LVVDSDPSSKTNATMLLQSMGRCDEAHHVASAETAFREAIEAGKPYGLLLVDIESTDSQETSILTVLRGIEEKLAVPPEKKVRIFVTTALSGRQLKTDCLMRGADEFLAKPLDKTLLFSKINKYGLLESPSVSAKGSAPTVTVIEMSAILDTINRKIAKGDPSLPPAPKIAMKLRQMIDLNAEIKEVVELLQQDLAVAIQLIRASNSAYYRGVERSANLTQATSRLGLDRTREVVMSICCQGYFVTNHRPYREMVETLWWHSLACAHTAEWVAERLGWKVEEDIFSIGLLHDIGKLLMIQVAGEMVQRKKGTQEVVMGDLYAAMKSHHERLGAAILEKMGYPEIFASLVKRHHRIDDPETTPRALQIIQRADLLAKAAGFGLGQDTPEAIAQAMEELGIDERIKEGALSEIPQRMEQLRYVFG
jgi:putative nucleotidyltransferase with HDIG domain